MTSKPVLLDSCVFASFMLARDTKHKEAISIISKLFKQLKNLRLVIPPLVIYETGTTVIKGGIDEKVIKNRLRKLLDYDQVIVMSLSEMAVFKHLRRTAKLHERYPSIRTHDMMILNTALEFEATMITFDQQLATVSRHLNLSTCTSADEFDQIVNAI